MKRLLPMVLFAATLHGQGPMPKNGFIPDETTAIKVAEAVLSPIYGEKQIHSERPFHAVLREGVWTVEGSLPESSEGGVAQIRLDQQTGKVLSYIHGK